ncbi:MAG: carbon storage regulator [Thermoguttaceae bacterium]|jgi:carbon storage regulator|nr:carbon storage regulator [Thermoguttaceae bacterium]
MLVLTRKTNERIRIGENVTITILRVKGHVVKVGIDAPQGVPVVRCELLERPVRASFPAVGGSGDAPDAAAHPKADSAEATESPADPLSAPAGREHRGRKAAPPSCGRAGRRAVLSGIAACWAM